MDFAGGSLRRKLCAAGKTEEIQIKTSDIQCYEYRNTDPTEKDKKISTTGITGGTDFYNMAKGIFAIRRITVKQ